MERLAKWGRKVGAFVDGWLEGEPTSDAPAPAPRAVDVESITETKREWMENQQSVHTRELATWPEHLFETFVVVGLPPDVEVTQIAHDLCEKEQKEHKRDAGPLEEERTSSQVAGLPRPNDRNTAASVRAPPWPSYEPSVIYRYTPADQPTAAAELSDKEIACMCFPNNVPPRRLRRSPSWSALHRVVLERQRITQEGRTFIFLLKVGASLPMYGVCCYVEEVLHRPPLLAKDNFPSCNGPFRQCLIAAPRCYCLISRYPFFPLHFSVLGKILDLEHLHRVLMFNAEAAELSGIATVSMRAPAPAASDSQRTISTEPSLATAPAPAAMKPESLFMSSLDQARASGGSSGAARASPLQVPLQLAARTSPFQAPAPSQRQQSNQAMFQRMSETYKGRDSKDMQHKRQSQRKVLMLQHAEPVDPQGDGSSGTLPVSQNAAIIQPHQQQHDLSRRLDSAPPGAVLAAMAEAETVARELGAGSPRLTRCSSGPPASGTEPGESGPNGFVSVPLSPQHSGAALARTPPSSINLAGGAGGGWGTQQPEVQSFAPSWPLQPHQPLQHLYQQPQQQQEFVPDADSSSHVVKEVEPLHLQPWQLLDHVFATDVPTPGDPLLLELSELRNFPAKVASLQYLRPQLHGRYTVVGTHSQLLNYAEAELAHCLQNWTLAAACRLLSLDTLLAMLTATLLEQQLVVFCPDVAACSALVLSLVPLLRPFTMQGLLLPVTPASLVSFVDAPVPFVLGLQYKTPDILARCTDLVRVNVYKDQVSTSVSLPPLPGLKELRMAMQPHYQVLRQAGTASGEVGCSPAHQLSKAEDAAALQLSVIVHGHLSAMVGDLRPHVITNVNQGKRTSMLMKASLVESFPRSNRAFIAAFVETQLFAVWCDQVLSMQMELVS